MVLLVIKSELRLFNYASFIGVVTAIRFFLYFGVDWLMRQIFVMGDLSVAEVLPEISTAGLISLTFALATKS